MFKSLRIILWEIVSGLEEKLYPYTCDDDYYITVKNDETGENYIIMDWIKCHNEKIDRLQDEMVFVLEQIRNLQKSNGQK